MCKCDLAHLNADSHFLGAALTLNFMEVHNSFSSGLKMCA